MHCSKKLIKFVKVVIFFENVKVIILDILMFFFLY
jgi:hypothetical protein